MQHRLHAVLASVAKFLAVLSMQPTTAKTHEPGFMAVARESKLVADGVVQPKTS